jgi:hypothetical protein
VAASSVEGVHQQRRGEDVEVERIVFFLFTVLHCIESLFCFDPVAAFEKV